MRTSAAALVLLVVAASACSDSGPSSQARDDPSVSTIPTPGTSSGPTLATIPVATSTSVPVATIATVAATTGPATSAASATTATATTTFPSVEDLEEGDHVGIIAAIDASGISFDRVEAVDADGDGNPESYTNTNPRLRAVPLPDNVLLDGQVTDAATVAQQLSGLNVLVRLTVVGQRLAAIQRLSLPV